MTVRPEALGPGRGRPAPSGLALVPPPRNGDAVRLFCLPFAGGGAGAFRQWRVAPPAGVEVVAFRYPGRESRLREEPARRIADLAAHVADTVQPYLDRPFAMFGHSMGALVAFEAARTLRDGTGREPVMLFVSGHRAPQDRDPSPPIHDLPDAELVSELSSRGGMPHDVDRELMRLLLPALRADLVACETYQYRPGRPLSCPVVALGGLDDPWVQPSGLRPWGDHTSGPFEVVLFPGRHFYLADRPSDVLGEVAVRLAIPAPGDGPRELAGESAAGVARR